MTIETGTMGALTLGFLLGLKHATDADHIVAVSTIVSQYRSAWRGIWVGASWGLGHTTPLVVIGILILVFGELLDGYKALAPVFEFGAGIMLVFLGIQVFWNLKRGRLHVHGHDHDNNPHIHVHSTHKPTASIEKEMAHSFFRTKSYVIGVIHGLAGSAAVMLLLLPTLSSFWMGISYILLFGLGTILSMATITVLIGVPFTATKGLSSGANRTVSGIAGTASVIFGAALMSEVMLNTSLIPF